MPHKQTPSPVTTGGPQDEGPRFMILYGGEVDIIQAHRDAAGITPDQLDEKPEDYETVLAQLMEQYQGCLFEYAISGGLLKAKALIERHLGPVEKMKS